MEEITGVIKLFPVLIELPPVAVLYHLIGFVADAVKVREPEPQRFAGQVTGFGGIELIVAVQVLSLYLHQRQIQLNGIAQQRVEVQSVQETTL